VWFNNDAVRLQHMTIQKGVLIIKLIFKLDIILLPSQECKPNLTSSKSRYSIEPYYSVSKQLLLVREFDIFDDQSTLGGCSGAADQADSEARLSQLFRTPCWIQED
jgi:hypothetical protein